MIKEAYLALLSVSAVLSLKECEHVGIYPGRSSREFTVCSDVNGTLVKSDHFCCNQTVFSPEEKKCVLPGLGLSLYSELLFEERVELECKKPGILCSNCNTLQICIERVRFDGVKEVTPVLNITCAPDETCQFRKGCTRVSDGGFCNLKPFQCTDMGMFPDPFNCKKYYFCVKDDRQKKIAPFESYCPENGGSFDIDSGNCGFPLDSPSCINRPVPLCEKEFQMGVVGNGNVYYICQSNEDGWVGPNMYRCPPGKSFDKNSYSCL